MDLRLCWFEVVLLAFKRRSATDDSLMSHSVNLGRKKTTSISCRTTVLLAELALQFFFHGSTLNKSWNLSIQHWDSQLLINLITNLALNMKIIPPFASTLVVSLSWSARHQWRWRCPATGSLDHCQMASLSFGELKVGSSALELSWVSSCCLPYWRIHPTSSQKKCVIFLVYTFKTSVCSFRIGSII